MFTSSTWVVYPLENCSKKLVLPGPLTAQLRRLRWLRVTDSPARSVTPELSTPAARDEAKAPVVGKHHK